MKTRIVAFNSCGVTLYDVQCRRWWWPFWNSAVFVTSQDDAQSFARDFRLGLLKP